MTRKAQLKTSALTASESVERRLASLEERVRRMPVSFPATQTTSTTITVQQASHGLAVGNVVRVNSSSAWVKSQADTATNATVNGIVTLVLSTDAFVVTTAGFVGGLSGLSNGTIHYLSATTAGALVTTAPSGQTQFIVPVILGTQTYEGVLLTPVKDGAIERRMGYLRNTYTSSGTWSAPANTRWVTLVAVAKGGDVVAGSIIGGGGAGACLRMDIDTSILTSIDYTISSSSILLFTGGATTTVYSGSTPSGGQGGCGGRVLVGSNAFPYGISNVVLMHGQNGATVTSATLAPGGAPGWGDSTLATGTYSSIFYGRGYGELGGSGARTAPGGCVLEYY